MTDPSHDHDDDEPSETESAFSNRVNRARWDSYMFEFEKLAAGCSAQGLDFQHYIEMATMAWGITGQSVDLDMQLVQKHKGAAQ